MRANANFGGVLADFFAVHSPPINEKWSKGRLLVLIDESGCPGFKLGKGSTPYFVVAMVIFNDYQEAERTSATIKQISNELKIKPEFKFSKCRGEVRDRFFRSVLKHDFKIRALVVEKEKIYSPKLKTNTDNFYNYFVQLLMRHDNDVLAGARIKIDGSGDREFKKAFAKYLRQQLGSSKIASVKFSDSRQDHLIQLADMSAGAIARSYSADSRKEPDRWRKMLSLKIDDIWEFK